MNSINCLKFFVAMVVVSFRFLAGAQEAAGDWVGQLNGGFKVRIHIAKVNSGYNGYLTNPSGNQTDLDSVVCDGSHLRFAVTKLVLSYDGTWDAQQAAWTGNLTYQQVYPLILKRATAADLAPAVHNRPQEAAIAAGPLPYFQKDVVFENTKATQPYSRRAYDASRRRPIPCCRPGFGYRAQYAR